MPDRITNQPAWWEELVLDPDFHELWWLEFEERRGHYLKFDDKNKIYFIISCERETQRQNLPLESNRHYFDSIVHDNKKIYPFMMHWAWVIHSEYRLRRLEKIKTNVHSSFWFDSLLGLSRRHRDFVYDWIQSNPEIKKITLLTYFRDSKNVDQFILSGIDKSNFGSCHGSGDSFSIDGETHIYSAPLPVEIYNETIISLVAETECDQKGWSFFTEKIAKPMLAGRPFVVISNQGYLRRLRTFGFRTFSDFIDESYDDIEDDEKRWTGALEQLYAFLSMPKNKILPMMSEVLEHNKRLIWQDWIGNTKSNIKQLSKLTK